MNGTTLRVLVWAGVLIWASAIPGMGQVANASDPGLIANPPGLQTLPRTDGETVVWYDFRDGDFADFDIYAASLADGREFPISAGPDSPSGLDIDAGRVVWAESRSCLGCERDIIGRDLRSERDFVVIDTAADETRPTISASWVVWLSSTNDAMRILARNIASADEPFLVGEIPAGLSVGVLAIDGERVIWTEGSSRGWQLMTTEIGTGTAKLIAAGTSMSGFSFGADIFGALVVYVDSSSNIVATNLETGVSTTIAGAPYDRFPTTDGRYVFWLHSTIPDDRSLFDVYAYDLATGSRFSVTAGDGQARSIHLGGGFATWSLGSDDETSIYASPIASVLPSAPRAAPDVPDENVRYFPDTGHALANGFKVFWEGNGGLPVFGFPLTDEFSEQHPDGEASYTVQYVERQRLEWHPEQQGTVYEVLLGRLGAQLLETQGRDWTTFPRADPATSDYFAETGHAIGAQFSTYWKGNGLTFGDEGVSFREALALFGYPLSEPMVEMNGDGDVVLTQYFERAVFEYHPDNPEPYRVLLRRVGAEMLAERGW